MKETWDQRYISEEYIYGKEPNQFFKTVLDDLDIKGEMLFPAEGEGRNAVYAAKKGITVFAFDISGQARSKAISFAHNENVQIQYEVGTISDLDLKPAFYDAAVLIYVHMPPPMRTIFHREIAKFIKPKGIVILEGFSKSNLEKRLKNPSVGGPSNVDFLFSLEEIKNDFQAFEILKLEEKETLLNEGSLHNGLANVVRFVGVKK